MTFKIYTQEIAEQLVKAIGEVKMAGEGGTFEVIASTEDIDRHGEIIRQNGWKLDNYMKNPVILVNHWYAVEKICGKATGIKIENGKMIISGVFAPNELGQEVRKLYEAGFLKTVSVGFIPLSRDEQNRDVITSAELLELSFVPIPANPEALALAKSLGLKGEMIEKSAELIAMELIQKEVSVHGENLQKLLEEIGNIKTLLADGKAAQPTVISDNEKALKEALQAIDRVAGATLGSIKKR